MRVLTQYELARMTRRELEAMLRSIACELAGMPQGSTDLGIGHVNLQNIRRALMQPHPGGPRS